VGPRSPSRSSQDKEGDFPVIPGVCCEHSAGFGGMLVGRQQKLVTLGDHLSLSMAEMGAE